MTPDGIREKFEYYREWLKALLIKEFFNLPTKYQENFLIMIENFLQDCKRIYIEGKEIKERPIQVKIFNIITPENGKDVYIVCAHSVELKDTINIPYPISRPKPKIGAKLNIILYSLDEQMWYSSKEELVTKK